MNRETMLVQLTVDELIDAMMPRLKSEVEKAFEEVYERVKQSPKPMGVKEVCEHLKCKPTHIYNLHAKGEIPCHKNGKKLLFYQNEIDDWMKSS